MSDGGAVDGDGIGLAEAIGILRDELLRARAAGAGSAVQLPVESMTVELTVTASRSVDGKAGFKVPFVGADLGVGRARGEGTEQRVTVVFGGPVDGHGRPVRIAGSSAEPKG
ncbi:trypco2 family protein [Streptomyces sp. NPDC088812]|uniref:trypco2 family protein n=1 Tax=Streptomyces sp. NPDC088812 TaxID=3365905 RepID=UPI0037F6D39D